jgi:hypothetical protein
VGFFRSSRIWCGGLVSCLWILLGCFVFSRIWFGSLGWHACVCRWLRVVGFVFSREQVHVGRGLHPKARVSAPSPLLSTSTRTPWCCTTDRCMYATRSSFLMLKLGFDYRKSFVWFLHCSRIWCGGLVSRPWILLGCFIYSRIWFGCLGRHSCVCRWLRVVGFVFSREQVHVGREGLTPAQDPNFGGERGEQVSQ